MERLTAVIIHASVLDSSSGTLFELLHYGGIATGVLLEAADAKSGLGLQQLMATVETAADVLQATIACHPATVAIALRSMIQQLGSQPAATCILAGCDQVGRLALLVPDCDFCSVGSTAAPPAIAVHDKNSSHISEVAEARDVLRHIVWSHAGDGTSFVVAVAMKHSRAISLAKRGFFPLLATDGMSYLPLDLARSIAVQGPFAAILHKASDMLEMTGMGVPEFSQQFRKVIEYQSCNGAVPFLDPLESVAKVLDRIALLHILQDIPAQRSPAPSLRAPRFLEVLSTDEWADMANICRQAGFVLPCLVKPACACGISASHAMTVILKPEAWPATHCMLPAVVQEFVDHAAALFKVYVIASEVHIVQKKSFPDLGQLPKVHLDTMSASIPFDSLAGSLPEELQLTVQAPKYHLNRQLVEWGALWLRRKLQLSLFGFDVVVDQHTGESGGCSWLQTLPVHALPVHSMRQARFWTWYTDRGSGDHVIIDVNYFPSFKEVPDAPAKLRMGILQAFSEQYQESDGDKLQR